MEGVHRALAGVDVEHKRVTCLAVVDGDNDPVVVLVPEQADMDAVVDPAVQLAHRIEEVSDHAGKAPKPAASRHRGQEANVTRSLPGADP